MATVSPWRNPNPNLPVSGSIPLQAQRPELVDELVADDVSLESTSSQSLPSSSTRSSNPNIQDSLKIGPPSLLHLSFNQHHGCFAAGTDQGFMIYSCDPFRELYSVQLRGIAVVEMLLKCNYCALVGGGFSPEFPPTKVMIWDNFQKQCRTELSFRCQVRAVKLRGDRIVVVLKQKIFVYNLYDQQLLHEIETTENPKGHCAISQVSGLFVLVCPGLHKGHIRVENYSANRTMFISAHDSRIACLALSQDGKFIATASTKGTLVRIFNTLDGSLLQEVRRGADQADIHSLAFSPTSQWLAVSSEKGTVHVFAVKLNLGMPVPVSGSSRSFMKGVLPRYFSSEWSVAQFRLPGNIQYTVGFGHEKNTIVIVGMDGSFYKCRFDPTTRGEMIQLEKDNFWPG